MLICMKVTGESFSFHHKSKRAEEAKDAKSIQTFRQRDCYRTELWRSLYKKAPTGQFLIIRKTHTEFTYKERFPNLLGRIFQVKRQSKRVIILLSCSGFLF